MRQRLAEATVWRETTIISARSMATDRQIEEITIVEDAARRSCHRQPRPGAEAEPQIKPRRKGGGAVQVFDFELRE